MAGEIAEVREHYAAEPGKGHLVEQLLNERANAAAAGAPDEVTARIDGRLADLGWVPAATREKAAKQRKAAAAAKAENTAGSEDAGPERQPPAGRTAPADKQQQAGGRQPPPPRS